MNKILIQEITFLKVFSMKYDIHNGYRIFSDTKIFGSTEVTNALQFLTAMEICETCIPNAKSELKLGNHIYDIKYHEKTIRIS